MIRKLISKNKFIYNNLRKTKLKKEKMNATKTKYQFFNQQKKAKDMCIILAGYKSFVYEELFARITLSIPENIDVCIVSSGVYSDELLAISKKNNWSYLSTSRNNVSVAQNLAITLFPNAEFIYKLDEDIFVTEDFFVKLKDTFNYVEEKGEYCVGFVAPLIPINGYGHYRILEKLNLLDYFNSHYEVPKYAAGPNRLIENSPEVAKFMWGENNIVPDIDELNKKFQEENFSYSACPIRFSIGAILYKRTLWEDMGMFKVYDGSGLGLDEEQLCTYCMLNSKAMIISENTVVGHLSFGSQNISMKEYFIDVLKEKLKNNCLE